MGGVIIALSFLNQLLSVIFASVGVNEFGKNEIQKIPESEDGVYAIDDFDGNAGIESLQNNSSLESSVSSKSSSQRLFRNSPVDGSTFFIQANTAFSWLSTIYFLNKSFAKFPTKSADNNFLSLLDPRKTAQELALRLACLDYPLSKFSRESQIISFNDNNCSGESGSEYEKLHSGDGFKSSFQLGFPISPCYMCHTCNGGYIGSQGVYVLNSVESNETNNSKILRLSCSVCARIKHSKHRVSVYREKEVSTKILSSHSSCADCGRPFVRISPSSLSFSFHSNLPGSGLTASDDLFSPVEQSESDSILNIKNNAQFSQLFSSWITSSQDFSVLPYILCALPFMSLFIRVFRVVFFITFFIVMMSIYFFFSFF
jgi:hypothetical protein